MMEFERYLCSRDLSLAVWEMHYNSYKRLCYEIERQQITDPYDAINVAFDEFNRLLKEYNIDIDRLIE